VLVAVSITETVLEFGFATHADDPSGENTIELGCRPVGIWATTLFVLVAITKTELPEASQT
jgi:hypothetical protein